MGSRYDTCKTVLNDTSADGRMKKGTGARLLASGGRSEFDKLEAEV